ncbi:hypothetical protein [Marinomonas transparens]|uniref:Uncharacterized protein n=1 Tax=Marinomonas transparens TaxID=2795388 RepID=A0A934JNW4_9GAMM|nr:hypothetical protein [Marinomonas transparens]MBJ7539251.1 hypothetical protein [Marinomonas transparens]
MKATRKSWTEDTAKNLCGSCGEDVETIKKEVNEGVSHLYHLEGENVDLWVVTRGESFPEGSQLVILCVGGKGMKEVGPFLIDQARAFGFASIRYHTKNPAVHRLYCGYGFGGVEQERVYKVDIGGADGQ